MLRHKDVISVLLGAVAGVGSKPTFSKLVHLYFSTVYKNEIDKYLFMRNISRIRGRIIAKSFPDCRNFGMLNYRTVICRTRPIQHHRVKQPSKKSRLYSPELPELHGEGRAIIKII